MSRQITCFLIDDDQDDQEIFLSVLHGFTPAIHCETADNGKEGLHKLLTGEVNPDIIFLDLNMPLMNGKQFLEARQDHEKIKHIPVIILSTSSDHKTILEARQWGAKHFITKPDKFSLWEISVRSVLQDSNVYAIL